MAKQGIVNIHGKQYKTVALRVNEFREKHPAYGLETELIQNTDLVIMKALIKDESGRVIATGYAEEKRGSTNINKTSALENCETSAIGRALAAFGLAGEEYASADEVANAINQQNKQSNKPVNKQPELLSKEKIAVIRSMLSEALPETVVCNQVGIKKLEEMHAATFNDCIEWIKGQE